MLMHVLLASELTASFLIARLSAYGINGENDKESA